MFLWINTKPRQHDIGQLAFTAGDHAGLAHDCCLDCSRVTTFAGRVGLRLHRGPIFKALAARIVEFFKKRRLETLQASI